MTQYNRLWDNATVAKETPWSDDFDRNSDIEIYVAESAGTEHFAILVEQRLGHVEPWRDYLLLKSNGERVVDRRFQARACLRFTLTYTGADTPSVTGGILRGVAR